MQQPPPSGGLSQQPMNAGITPPPQQYAAPQPLPQQWGMVAPPQYPYHHQQQQPMWSQQQPSQIPSAANQMLQYPAVPPAAPDEIRTLWIGDIQPWMDESYLLGCFQGTDVISAKIIRNKLTGLPESYGFIEFASRASAETVLQTYSGQMMPNIEQKFRLNWASHGAGEKRDDSADYTIYVGDLSADVTDYMLQETFKTHYPSVKGAKVVIDRITGRSKGYGFVRFSDANEQARAMTEMNGMLCYSRPMRIGPASSKRNFGTEQQYSANASQTTTAVASETDPNNTTIFVGNLDASITEDHLRQLFTTYGALIHVKIPAGKRCGFVQFAKRACAEEALLMLDGSQVGGQSIRLSWGRSASSRQEATAAWTQPQQDPNQWSNGYYGYSGYESYGYAAAPQDPNMYAYAAYTGYGNYQQPQTQEQQQ